MNPEFQRNVWKELTTNRLIALPIILFAIFLTSYLSKNSSIPAVAFVAIVFLLSLWGTSLTADAVFEEISERTWDSQKMTPLGPWSFAWGKLFGCPIFVWYGALLCVVAILISFLIPASNAEPNVTTNIDYYKITLKTIYFLELGLLSQCFAFFLALLIQRINPVRNRTKVTLIQISAILLILPLFSLFDLDILETRKVVQIQQWYNFPVQFSLFYIGSVAVFIGWCVLGIYRFLRSELQIPTAPIIWPLFILFFIFFCIGFIHPTIYNPDAKFNQYLPSVSSLYLCIGFFFTLSFTFISAFFTPKSAVTLRKWLDSIKLKAWYKAFVLTPPWVVSLFLGLILGILAIISIRFAAIENSTVINYATNIIYFIVASFFFLLRDIGILYFVTLNIRSRRGHATTIVYLALLYFLLPVLLAALPASRYTELLVMPISWLSLDYKIASSAIETNSMLILVLVEALIAWALVMKRWRSIYHRI